VLSAALLAAAWAVGISIPASAAPVKGSLDIVSVVDQDSELAGPVQDKFFDVTVRVLDSAGQPTTVTQATTVVLEASGTGALSGTTAAEISRNGSSATIRGAKYSQFENGVVLSVRASSGVNLTPDQVTVEVALTAVGAKASNGSLDLNDATCDPPTMAAPNCGHLLLPNGASSHVTLSVGSCDRLGCLTAGALVVTAIADLENRYTNTSPATLILACDKDLCKKTANGVPWIDVIYTFNNSGPLIDDNGAVKVAPSCSAKGVVDAGLDACVDRVQSRRQDGDLYLYFLFTHDLRISI
jgi:hypothetical protein